MTALTIWEAAVTPYLYNSACCWLEIPKAALSLLDSLQEEFMRVMLQTPRTTPLVALYWDLGAPLAANRVIESKVRFYFHLLHLNKESLAFKIFENRRKMKFGFVKECQEYLAVLNMKESHLLNYSDREFKKILSIKIKDK